MVPITGGEADGGVPAMAFSDRPAMMRLGPPAILPIVALAMAGCSLDDEHVWLGGAETLQLARATAPAETYETQESRAQDIFERSDSLLYSTWYVESNFPGLPFYTITPVCSGPVCTVTNENTESSDSFDKFDLSGDFGERRPILTRSGITTIEAFNEQLSEYEEYGSFRSYGSWMSHTAFAVETFDVEIELENGFDLVLNVRAALVGGEQTGGRPDGTATWRGIMVGTTHAGPVRGDILQGDAALVFTAADGGSLQAAFTDIVNLDRRQPHATPSVSFTDVPMHGDGTFRKGELGNRIHGALYGPGHVEAAGIFEHSNIVGAFGARTPAGQ